jgi:hypothetical protein
VSLKVLLWRNNLWRRDGTIRFKLSLATFLFGS